MKDVITSFSVYRSNDRLVQGALANSLQNKNQQASLNTWNKVREKSDDNATVMRSLILDCKRRSWYNNELSS